MKRVFFPKISSFLSLFLFFLSRYLSAFLLSPDRPGRKDFDRSPIPRSSSSALYARAQVKMSMMRAEVRYDSPFTKQLIAWKFAQPAMYSVYNLQCKMFFSFKASFCLYCLARFLKGMQKPSEQTCFYLRLHFRGESKNRTGDFPHFRGGKCLSFSSRNSFLTPMGETGGRGEGGRGSDLEIAAAWHRSFSKVKRERLFFDIGPIVSARRTFEKQCENRRGTRLSSHFLLTFWDEGEGSESAYNNLTKAQKIQKVKGRNFLFSV